MRHVLIAFTSLALIVAPTAAAAQPVGQLIAADPVTDTPAGMQASRVRHWTSDGSGRPREVVPRELRRVIAWTHGTWGIASCAPSLSANCWTVTAGLEAVKRGDVVVAPDYSGTGDRFATKPAPSDCGRG